MAGIWNAARDGGSLIKVLSMSSALSDRKSPILDGLRAVSILLVLACHLLPLGPKELRLNEAAGAMGMSLFFALSGYLITSTLIRNPNIEEFLMRRLSRILPLAYAYTLVVFLLFSFDPNSLLWTNLFVVNYLTQYLNDWNGHFWSLCVEMQFYLAIAVVVLALGRRGLWIVWPACVAVTLMRANAEVFIEIKTHLRVDEILSGACVATLYNNCFTSYDRFAFRILPAMMIVATILWAVSAWPLAYAAQYFRPYTTALLLFVSLNYGVARPVTLLASRPMRYIAAISYALYVIHPATAHGWMNDGSTMTRYLLKRPISFALTFILAHLSTFHWESRWQSAAKSWVRRRREIKSAQVVIAPTKTSPSS
jgi:peptidoglycan/LPS O-acetylase OafA/YrhL